MTLAKASRAMTIIARVYSKYRLKLNFSKGKSEAVVVFRGAGAKSCRAQLAFDAKSEFDFTCDDEVQRASVVPRYRRLGAVPCASGSMDLEVRNDAAAAAVATNDVSQVHRQAWPWLSHKSHGGASVCALQVVLQCWELACAQRQDHAGDQEGVGVSLADGLRRDLRRDPSHEETRPGPSRARCR